MEQNSNNTRNEKHERSDAYPGRVSIALITLYFTNDSFIKDTNIKDLSVCAFA